MSSDYDVPYDPDYDDEYFISKIKLNNTTYNLPVIAIYQLPDNYTTYGTPIKPSIKDAIYNLNGHFMFTAFRNNSYRFQLYWVISSTAWSTSATSVTDYSNNHTYFMALDTGETHYNIHIYCAYDYSITAYPGGAREGYLKIRIYCTQEINPTKEYKISGYKTETQMANDYSEYELISTIERTGDGTTDYSGFGNTYTDVFRNDPTDLGHIGQINWNNGTTTTPMLIYDYIGGDPPRYNLNDHSIQLNNGTSCKLGRYI